MIFQLVLFKCAYEVPYLGYRHFFCLTLPKGLYHMPANNKGPGEAAYAQNHLSFAGRLSDKYPFLMCYLKYPFIPGLMQ